MNELIKKFNTNEPPRSSQRREDHSRESLAGAGGSAQSSHWATRARNPIVGSEPPMIGVLYQQ